MLRIATTQQLERSVREAGFEAHLLPDVPSLDHHRSLDQRLADGAVYRPFLEKHNIDLVIDFNAAALTLTPSPSAPKQLILTTAALGIPHVAIYLDPITSVMNHVPWEVHWQLLESPSWIKCIWESAHSQELIRMGIPNVIQLPMAAANDDFDTQPPPEVYNGPPVAFMGHPASSWFSSQQTIQSHQLFAGFTAAAVRADMNDVPFHKTFFDLYQFGQLPQAHDDPAARAAKSSAYFAHKFIYQAYLAVKQRERFVRFLKLRLGDQFELIGDHWDTNYGLKCTPRIWDMRKLHGFMRQVPINLNFMKGACETGVIIRHFEVTAYGGFLLTYPSLELANHFEIGSECDVFHDEGELLEKIDYYLDHPRERREIAAAGQQRVLREHLYSHRIVTLVDKLRGAGCLLQRSVTISSAEKPLPHINVQGVTDKMQDMTESVRG